MKLIYKDSWRETYETIDGARWHLSEDNTPKRYVTIRFQKAFGSKGKTVGTKFLYETAIATIKEYESKLADNK